MPTDERSEYAQLLLARIRDKSAGRLTIFLGAAPGVGKTYAMLNTARERVRQGVDVVVGLVETHGRAETEAMLTDLEQLPRHELSYKGTSLTEFDLDAALARKPALILVDELAHTNAPGSRHKRRYQDIAELLAAGLDVYTTVNVQHLASLNDLVLRITGVRVRETVPDQFIDDAHEILFIDLPPATLIERLQQGKVYMPEHASAALDSFFSPANLTALRELAMREVMERVDSQLTHELGAQAKPPSFAIQEKLLVLISHNSDHEYLIRSGRQIADRRKIPWLVIWVDTGQPLRQVASQRLQSAFSLARELGADSETLRGGSTYDAVVPFLAQHRINSVLVGAGTRRRFWPWRRRLYQQLIESDLALEVTVLRASDTKTRSRTLAGNPEPLFGGIRDQGFAFAMVALATALALPLEMFLSNANLALVYVLAVIVTGLKAGPGPAVAGSFLAFLSFNFFLTEPRYTFHVMRHHEVATLVFMLLIALVCGPVASRIRRQILLLRQANRYSEAMRLLGQELSVAEDVADVWLALVRVIKSTLNVDRVQNVDCVIVATDDNESHQAVPPTTSAFAPLDTAAIDWTRKHGRSSGRFSDTLNAANWAVFPINKQNRCIACALIKTEPDMRALNAEDTALITAILQQGADTWRRIQLVSELEFARIKTEMEQLRSALLSSVSHDLKSPLSAMMGAAESLQLLDRQLTPSDRAELADTILQESRRLDTYIQNLLDMTRLGHGGLKIERDWVSVADIIGSALARLKRYFPGVKLECQLPTPAPVIYVHAALVEQAIFNILENAAKFSPPDETIRILVQATDNRCVIEIEDRGPGIPEAMREKVFDMFYVVADGDQKKQNTGMGLAICRGMIGAHGGSVKAVAGSGNKGTCFIVELPIHYPSGDQVH